jgi:hypothetical protein
MCMVREWDLSYECLESRKARQALRELKETDPAFYTELMAGKNLLVPGQARGEVLDEAIDEDSDNKLGPEVDEEGDDCYLSISQIVETVVKETNLMGVMGPRTESMAKPIAENSDEAELERELEELEHGSMDASDERGRGKRTRKPNSLYASHAFWRHYDEDTSDSDA